VPVHCERWSNRYVQVAGRAPLRGVVDDLGVLHLGVGVERDGGGLAPTARRARERDGADAGQGHDDESCAFHGASLA
jgi:hypothetical protein